jgi:membrane protein DedA with SNARE-associated domain
VYTLLGCLPWTFGLTYLGYKLGERWDEVERVIRPFSWALAVLLVLGVAWWIWHRLRTIRTERAEIEAARAETEPTETAPERTSG